MHSNTSLVLWALGSNLLVLQALTVLSWSFILSSASLLFLYLGYPDRLETSQRNELDERVDAEPIQKPEPLPPLTMLRRAAHATMDELRSMWLQYYANETKDRTAQARISYVCAASLELVRCDALQQYLTQVTRVLCSLGAFCVDFPNDERVKDAYDLYSFLTVKSLQVLDALDQHTDDDAQSLFA